MRNTPETLLPGFGRVSWGQRRQLEGLDSAQRLRALGGHLQQNGSIAVRDSHAGLFGDRWTIWLDDNTLLKLKLFWVVKDNLAAVTHVWWNDYIGWMVRGRNTAGEVITLSAWNVRTVAGLTSLTTAL